jgi:endonuclease YncB( thermonuclease family)
MSNNAVAESLGMHHEVFKRHWRDRYGRVLAKVQSFDAEVNRAVSRQVCADMQIYF